MYEVLQYECIMDQNDELRSNFSPASNPKTLQLLLLLLLLRLLLARTLDETL